MRILLYTQFCTPEPVFKSVPFARELLRRGHDVRILTGFPNYPGGSIYPGYRLRLHQREEVEGVSVERTWLYPSHDKSGVRRIANYLSFAATSAPRLFCGWRPDIIYIYNLPTLGVVAAINQVFRNVPYVIDIQDLWPDSIAQSQLAKSWLLAPIERLCRLAYKRAARVAVLSPGFRRTLADRGVAVEKIRVIYNWCDESSLLSDNSLYQFPEKVGFRGRFNILFAGNMGVVQGLQAVIDAAAITAKTHPRIQFVFMGGGVMLDELKKYALTFAPQSTCFLSARPLSEAARVLRSADVLLLHLRDNPLFSITIPSKTQAYLAMGKPILAAIRGDTADLVTRAEAGEICEPDNPASIAEAAIRLSHLEKSSIEMMGTKGAAFYQRELSFATGVTRFEQLFAEARAN